MTRKTPDNSTYKKLAVQWLNEAFPLRRDRSCFVSSFPAEAGQVVVADPPSLRCGREGSFVLPNRQLLVAENR